MDLAKDNFSDQSAYINGVVVTLNMVNFGLVGYLVWISLMPFSDSMEIFRQFLEIRNSLFMAYALVAAVLVMTMLLHRSQRIPHELSPVISRLIPQLVFNIVFTTFAYSISRFISQFLGFLKI